MARTVPMGKEEESGEKQVTSDSNITVVLNLFKLQCISVETETHSALNCNNRKSHEEGNISRLSSERRLLQIQVEKCKSFFRTQAAQKHNEVISENVSDCIPAVKPVNESRLHQGVANILKD